MSPELVPEPKEPFASKYTSTSTPYVYEKNNTYSIKLNRSSPSSGNEEDPARSPVLAPSSNSAPVGDKFPDVRLTPKENETFSHISEDLTGRVPSSSPETSKFNFISFFHNSLMTLSAVTSHSSQTPANDSQTLHPTIPEIIEETLTTKPTFTILPTETVGTNEVSYESSDMDNEMTTEGVNSDKLMTTTVQSTELPETTTSFPIETMDGSELTTLIQLLTTMNSVTSPQNQGQDKRPSMTDGTTSVTKSQITTETPTSSSSFLNNNISAAIQAEVYEPVDNNTIPSHVINQSSTQYVTEVTSTRPYINKLGNISFDSS